MNPAGWTVLITGASRGLGAALVRAWLSRGAVVIGMARNQAGLDALRQQADLSGWADRLRTAPADVIRPDSVISALESLAVDPKIVDVVVANAGIKLQTDELLDQENYRLTLETNLFGAMNTLAPILPAMAARNAGRVVLVSSMGRHHGMTASGSYNASKAALSIFGESLRMDLLRRGLTGIRVSVVEPGLLATDMTALSGLSKLLMIDAERAAEAIVDGVIQGRAQISPPLIMSLLTRIVSALPARLRARILLGAAKDRK